MSFTSPCRSARALAVRQGCVLFLSWLLRVESWEEEIGAGTVRQGGAWREAGSWNEKNRSWALGKLRLHELDLFESLASWQEGPVQFRPRVSEAAATLARVEKEDWGWSFEIELGVLGLGVLISLELGPVATFWVSRANHGSSVLSWFQVLSSFYRNCRSARAWFQLNQASASKARFSRQGPGLVTWNRDLGELFFSLCCGPCRLASVERKGRKLELGPRSGLWELGYSVTSASAWA
ncbi:unnamed protein product [Prunus armeniaca]|uniref:Uncharacterized protein n=1 Tax=Prunus armeniaca TaxID=36596 RepID=A0A6J5UKN3_PRUAR|nr:unnamed protein product [Prunus armeniaca]